MKSKAEIDELEKKDPYTLTTEELAQLACANSRSIIILGTTRPEFNDYDPLQQVSVSNALRALRDEAKNFEGISPEINTAIVILERSVALCTKLSIGNCQEHALIDLQYVLNKRPDVPTELVSLDNGDHCVALIGRDPNSNPDDPSTWGKNAYISDPVTADVYHVSQYKEKFKPWLSPEHKDEEPKLFLFTKFTSKYVKDRQNEAQELIVTTIYSYQKMINIYENMLKTAEKIADRAKNKYGENDPRYQILQEKIDNLRGVISMVKESSERLSQIYIANTNPKKSYSTIMNEVRFMNSYMDATNKNLLDNLSFQDNEKKLFKKHSIPFVGVILKLLHIPPTTYREYKALINDTKEQLGEKPQLPPSPTPER